MKYDLREGYNGNVKKGDLVFYNDMLCQMHECKCGVLARALWDSRITLNRPLDFCPSCNSQKSVEYSNKMKKNYTLDDK